MDLAGPLEANGEWSWSHWNGSVTSHMSISFIAKIISMWITPLQAYRCCLLIT